MNAAVQTKRHSDPDRLLANAPRALVILVGLPASGKSTFFRTHFAATHRHVSKDLMRNVRNRDLRQRELIAQALTHGQPVVVDNVNASAAERVHLVALGRAHGARIIGYHFDSLVRECLARNASRGSRQRVPDVAIHVAAKRFEAPTYPEGFDCLYRVRLVGQSDFEIIALPP
jgi:predicted kinase